MATVRLSQQLHRQLLDAAKEKYKVTNPEPNQSPELMIVLRATSNYACRYCIQYDASNTSDSK